MTFPLRSARLLALAGILATLPSLPLAAKSGPTPYPDAKDEAAWPGRGPIHLYDWMPRSRDEFWARRAGDRNAVVFAGDSLTYGWPEAEMTRAAGGGKVARRGIGGDVSRGLLFRFQEDVLDLDPRALVLLIGTNDLSEKAEPAIIAQNIAALIDLARKANSRLPIVLCAVPPRDSAEHPIDPAKLAELNALLAALAASRKGVVGLDLFKVLADAKGKPVPEYFAADRLHIAGPGYRAWADALAPALETLGVR